MKPKPAQQLQIDVNVLSSLACPACFGDLRLDVSHLVCIACTRAYPIIDGIPVLIAERAADPQV
jgi:uncharacterized protein YbaR (Trm112 family)